MGETDAGEEESLAMIGGNEEKIFVSVRLRPLNAKEIARNDVSDWECVNDNTVAYNNVNISLTDRSMYPTSYTFDRVFSCDCSTEQVYKEGAKEIALSVISGINSSIFAYGQTSSGKTFTMNGITEYTLADIFDHIRKHQERDFLLKISAMEIYNESVRDLLVADGTPLRLLDDPERGTIVEGLTEETLRDWNHFIELISICEAQRQIGETSLNVTSSRSHQIIRLIIESSARESLCKENNLSTLVAAVNFVDLAGSERASQSLSAGTRLKEGCHINRSLLTLGTVIRKLSKGRNEHIPYRDSKLTRILQSSLGGNARTAIICTMSPARSYVEQSRNTLFFASCAKEVSTSAQINVVMSDKVVIKQLQREVARLESKLRNTESILSTSNSDALLREKDLQLERMEKELKELIRQRDIAQSQVQDMTRLVSDDRYLRGGLDCHPNLLLSPTVSESTLISPISPESNLLWIKSPEYGNPLSVMSKNSGTSSSVTNYIQDLTFEEKFPNKIQSNLHYSENDSCLSLEEIEGQSDGSSVDLCKDVQCIETENMSTNQPVESSLIYLHETKRKRANQDLMPPQLKDDIDSISSPPLDEEKLSFPQLVGDKELCCIYLSKNPSPKHVVTEDSRRLSLTKSRSCKASFMDSMNSMWVEKVESNDNMHTPLYGSERDFIRKPQCLQNQHNGLNYYADVEQLSRESSESIRVTATLDDEFKHYDPVLDNPVKEKGATGEESKKNVKDVGLDPIEDDYRNNPNCYSEFLGLQRKIIELWDTCNISLVHRTYFLLMFKGDPADSIYMEMELRRLLYLKDTFSQGSFATIDGRTVTFSTSMKALHRERKMLRKKMQNRISEQERESLYFKWGIELSTKNRGLQLVYRIWSDPQDMDHINESAVLVSKLVGSVGSDWVPKETLGLNFTHQHTRTGNLKSRLMSMFQSHFFGYKR